MACSLHAAASLSAAGPLAGLLVPPAAQGQLSGKAAGRSSLVGGADIAGILTGLGQTPSVV